MIKDSGNRTAFESGAVRDIQEGKGRCDLLPLHYISYWCNDPILEAVAIYTDKEDRTDTPPKYLCARDILNMFTKEYMKLKGIHDDPKTYRYSLVLEVAKHFEEGAKKYGDRNWEKGIPCDRYIDSAVRHYCKWRAGWDDEPHDRAFIWNILCCEWTRQRYGWNLERLETAKKYENILGMKTELLDHKCLMSGTLRSVASDFNNKKRFTRSACLYLYDRYGQPAGRVWILNARKSANLYAAIGNVWRRNDDVTLKILEAELAKYEWKPGVDFVVEAFDVEESESKKFAKIGEQMAKGVHDGIRLNDDTEITLTVNTPVDFNGLCKALDDAETTGIKDVLEVMKKSLGCKKQSIEHVKKCLDTACSECEYKHDPSVCDDYLQTLIDYVEKSLKVQERRNPYVKDTDEGWHFYDKDGQLIGYIFKFKEPEEGRKRQLSNMIHKVWHEATSNPYTIKRIVEEWGYVCGKDFSICIAPSITAKEYDFRNRKYNEEDSK